MPNLLSWIALHFMLYRQETAPLLFHFVTTIKNINKRLLLIRTYLVFLQMENIKKVTIIGLNETDRNIAAPLS